jgi:predicted esterase
MKVSDTLSPIGLARTTGLLIVVGLFLCGCGVAGSALGLEHPPRPPGTFATSAKQALCSDSAHESCDLTQGGKTDNVPVDLPTVHGPCPDFHAGKLIFRPKGTKERKALVWIGSEARTNDGPLVFYFQGTDMSPRDAIRSLGMNNIRDIEHMGGMVVSPYPDMSTQYPWFIANGDDREDDLLLVDEIVACAIQKVGIDTRRIHATGFSAGGMLVSDLALRRANYIASTSPQSGGLSPWNEVPRNAEPENKSATMIFYGGKRDSWYHYLYYQLISARFRDEIVRNGGFAIMCNHGRGHRVPPKNARNAVWQFFKDHPWNTRPSPYFQGLPPWFPAYCSIRRESRK